MTKDIDKLTEFILMEKSERMQLDAGYRRSYNFLARKRLNEVMLQIESFTMGDVDYVKKTQLEAFIRVISAFLKKLTGAENIKIEVTT